MARQPQEWARKGAFQKSKWMQQGGVKTHIALSKLGKTRTEGTKKKITGHEYGDRHSENYGILGESVFIL